MYNKSQIQNIHNKILQLVSQILQHKTTDFHFFIFKKYYHFLNSPPQLSFSHLKLFLFQKIYI